MATTIITGAAGPTTAVITTADLPADPRRLRITAHLPAAHLHVVHLPPHAPPDRAARAADITDKTRPPVTATDGLFLQRRRASKPAHNL